ncbi:hypothetical protein LAJ55_16150, partial [Streptococcus pneumoniae]|uniref:hypothetical protein n=1 Tax=Streptococcus pneumoniae TaxID=1313 RepID=UPI001CBFACDF
FTDNSFSGGALQAVAGRGYTDAKNLTISLDLSDGFGTAVALNAAGNLLAVGAPGDASANNNIDRPGAVYLFSFADS